MSRIGFIKIICFLLFVSSCADKENRPDCSIIRNGKFEYRGGFSTKHFTIQRDDSIQIEKDPDTGLGMKFKIEWDDECHYELKLISFIIGGKDSLIKQSEFPTVKTEVVKVTKNYYVCRSSLQGKNSIRRDTMLIIK
jgi:hypothetical protein